MLRNYYLYSSPSSLQILPSLDGQLLILFVCPRCDGLNVIDLPALDLNTSIFLECSSLACCDGSKGQSIGFSFVFSLPFGIQSPYMLPLLRRPLN